MNGVLVRQDNVPASANQTTVNGQPVEADNAVQSAHIAIAVVERVAGVLRGQMAGPPLPSAGSR